MPLPSQLKPYPEQQAEHTAETEHLHIACCMLQEQGAARQNVSRFDAPNRGTVIVQSAWWAALLPVPTELAFCLLDKINGGRFCMASLFLFLARLRIRIELSRLRWLAWESHEAKPFS